MWLTRVPVWGRWADLVSFLPVRDAVEWGQERELRMLLPMGSMLGGSHVSRVWVTGDSRAGKHLAKELAEQAWSFSRDIPVFWVKLLNITTLLWLDFLWKRKKGQNSRSKYGMVQPWWSCKNSGEEAERNWGNDKWNCGESSVGPQALPSALSPQFLRTWVHRLPLGWGQILSEKLHSEDTMFNYIVVQPIDIIWNP